MKFWYITTILLLIMFFFFMFVNHEKQDCESQGGDYVRGLYWFECVK